MPSDGAPDEPLAITTFDHAVDVDIPAGTYAVVRDPDLDLAGAGFRLGDLVDPDVTDTRDSRLRA